MDCRLPELSRRKLEPAFSRAQEDPSYRQEFIDSVLQERGLPEYVSFVKYIPENTVYSRLADLFGSVMIAASHPAYTLHISGLRTALFVDSSSFIPEESDHHNLDDFLSTLEDHEYLHAADAYYAPESMALNILSPQIMIDFLSEGLRLGRLMKSLVDASELRAYDNQIKMFPQRRCSEAHKDLTYFLRDKYTESASRGIWGRYFKI